MNSKFRINPQLSTTPGPEMQSQWLGKTREKTKKKNKKKNNKKKQTNHTGGVFQTTILGPLLFSLMSLFRLRYA